MPKTFTSMIAVACVVVGCATPAPDHAGAGSDGDRLAQRDRTIDELRVELAARDERIARLESDLSAARVEFEQLDQRARALDDERTWLRDRLVEAEERHQRQTRERVERQWQLEAEVAELESELERLHEELRDAEQRRIRMQSELRVLEASMDQLAEMYEGGRDPASEPDAMPVFPDDVPAPSAHQRLPRAAFASADTLADVVRVVNEAMWSADYGSCSYYRFRERGVAVVTQLQVFESDGSVADDARRFQRPGERGPFASITELFFAPKGSYRLVVFLVSDEAYTMTGDPFDDVTAFDAYGVGASRLPALLAGVAFSDAHEVDALVYEFVTDARGVRQPDGALLTVRQHLEASGLADALGF